MSDGLAMNWKRLSRYPWGWSIVQTQIRAILRTSGAAGWMSLYTDLGKGQTSDLPSEPETGGLRLALNLLTHPFELSLMLITTNTSMVVSGSCLLMIMVGISDL